MRRWKRIFALSLASLMLFSTPVYAAESADVVPETKQEEVRLPETAIAPVKKEKSCVDVVLVGDHSGSIGDRWINRDAALRKIVNLACGSSDIRIGGVYFGDYVAKTKALTKVDDKSQFEEIKQFFNMSKEERAVGNTGTYIGAALEEACNLLDLEKDANEKIIVLFSDGINESEEQDEAVKKDRDAETKKFVENLDGKVKIYCVYLEQYRNDSAYLRDLVNYFHTENTYDQERFHHVKLEEIDQLSSIFQTVFNEIQSNVKYDEIQVDSFGKMNFYVPELGINRIQLCVENDSAFDMSIVGQENAKVNEWNDGTTKYITVESPNTGDCNLTVSPEVEKTVKGTIAYYATMHADAKLEGLKDYDGNILKNKEQCLKVKFYDEQGKEIELDDQAQITGKLFLTYNDGTTEELELTFEKSESGYESQPIVLTKYGSYQFEMHVGYKEFIDLNYELIDGEIVEQELLVFNKNEETYLSERNKNGHTFELKAENLYRDPEGDSIKIKKVTALNEDNPVKVTEENGIITVTTEKMGKVEFRLDLLEETGKTASVTVKGNVLDTGVINIMKIAVIGLLVLLVLLLILKGIRKNKKVREERATLAANKEKVNQILTKVQELNKLYADSNAEEDKKMIALEEAVKELNIVCGALEEEQLADFGVCKYMQDGYAESYKKSIGALRKNIETKKRHLETDAAGLNMDSNDELKEYISKAELSIPELKRDVLEYQKVLEECVNEENEIMNNLLEIEEILDTPIECDLHVYINRANGGAKSCQNGILTGGYSLGDIKVLYEADQQVFLQPISSIWERSTGLWIYGYDEQHLEIRSSKEFNIKNIASGSGFEKVKTYKLEKDEDYQVQFIGDATNCIIKVRRG